jgi:hypothetical protein
MDLTMKHLLAILSLCLSSLAMASGLAPDRVLPHLLLADPQEALTTEETLKRPTPWVLMVVDPASNQTQPALNRLHKKEGGWGEGLVVVATGDQAALKALITRNEKLTGVRWLRDMTGKINKTLQLRGTPAVIGIRPDNQVAWKVTGLPEQDDKAQSMVGAWISFPVSTNAQKPAN